MIHANFCSLLNNTSLLIYFIFAEASNLSVLIFLQLYHLPQREFPTGEPNEGFTKDYLSYCYQIFSGFEIAVAIVR